MIQLKYAPGRSSLEQTYAAMHNTKRPGLPPSSDPQRANNFDQVLRTDCQRGEQCWGTQGMGAELRTMG